MKRIDQVKFLYSSMNFIKTKKKYFIVLAIFLIIFLIILSVYYNFKISLLKKNQNNIIIAINQKNYKSLKLLFKNANKSIINFSLLYSIYMEDIDAYKLLVESGADINFKYKLRGKYSVTPLMLASDLGYYELVNLLIMQNVDIFEQDEHGNTALHQGASWFFENFWFYIDLHDKYPIPDNLNFTKSKNNRSHIIQCIVNKDINIIKIKNYNNQFVNEYILNDENELLNKYFNSINKEFEKIKKK